jgi:DNA polymerase III subunit alpha
VTERGHERSEHGLDELSVHVPIHRDGHGHETPVVIRKVKRTRRLPQRSREMQFASLHHHTTFSYGDGYALPSAHARRAAEIGLNTMAVTEHGNVSSHVQLEQAAKKEGIKPIYGVELYTGEIGESATQRKNHLTVLAESLKGYRNLLRLVSKTYSEGFHYEPTASGKMLKQHADGLIILSGCQGSALFTALAGGKHVAEEDASVQRANRLARRYREELGDRYYIEIQAFPELEKTRQANPDLVQIAESAKIPYTVTFDCHYTVPEEKEMQQILHNLRPGERRSLEDMAREWGYDSNLCPPWSDAMIVRKLIGTGLTRQQAIRAIITSRDIADRCDAIELPSLDMVRFKTDGSSPEVWRQMIRDGWKYRRIANLSQAEIQRYKMRLAHEMKIIEDKDFIDYFLIIADMVQWAKNHDIAVGPARGSAAGSLVCWLLRITEVNPMLYDDLVFERFIDVTRVDLPDIDIDFSSDKRNDIWDYMISRYGEEQVSNVGTFTRFRGKNSLDAAARVYHVPLWEIQQIKDVLIERSSGDLRASATIEDTAEQFPQARVVFEKHPDLGAALDLEGNYAGFGVHSAGMVISTGPITDVAAIYERDVKGEKRRVISMDKYDAERKGLLKIDALGLSTVEALDHMRQEVGWDLDTLYNLPLEDDDVLEGFKLNDVTGIFQFDGRACRYVNGALKPDHFKHVYDVTALGRPGPLHNGAANAYIDVKWGRADPEQLHPAMGNICDSTYGQIVYQEQILRLLGDIFNFDWTHRAEVRRIISKKHGDQEFNRKWEEARKGAMHLHGDDGIMTEDLARHIWMKLITAGSYAFNASHAVSYGLIGWQTMWFKRKYPEVFFKCQLNVTGDKDKTKRLLRDTQRFGRKLEIRPPHPRFSGVGWSKGRNKLRSGFNGIPGVGAKIAQAITEQRGSITKSWDDLSVVHGVGPKTIQTMRDFAKIDDPFEAMWLDKAIAAVKEEIDHGSLQGLPRPTHVSADLPYETGADIPVIWCGVIFTRNERDLFEFNQAKGAELDMTDPKHPLLDGKPIRDPHLDKWVVCVGDDESDQLGLRVDRWRYPRLRNTIWKMRLGKDVVLVRGVKPGFMPTRQVTISEMWLIDPEI